MSEPLKVINEVTNELTIDLFQKDALKEEPSTTKDATVIGARYFSCTEFGEIPAVKEVLDAMRNGEFLNSSGTRQADAKKVKLTVGGLGEDEVWVTNATTTDLHRQCDFFIIDHKGDQISFSKKSIKQPETRQPKEPNGEDNILSFNSAEQSQEADNIAFFSSIAPVIYTEENKAYVPKFFNLLGKYFHQAGVGVFINTYLCALGTDKGIIVTGGNKNNNVVFDLTRLNQGIIKITEHFEFHEARDANNPEEIFKREDSKPIAIFTFPFTVQVNNLNDQCIVEPLPLKMDVMDVKLMGETYMPALNHAANFAPIAVLEQINSTVRHASSYVSSYVSSLIFNSPTKTDHSDHLSVVDEPIAKSHSDEESSKGDSSGKESGSNSGSPTSSLGNNNSNSPTS
jgi:hypothetical protein